MFRPIVSSELPHTLFRRLSMCVFSCSGKSHTLTILFKALHQHTCNNNSFSKHPHDRDAEKTNDCWKTIIRFQSIRMTVKLRKRMIVGNNNSFSKHPHDREAEETNDCWLVVGDSEKYRSRKRHLRENDFVRKHNMAKLNDRDYLLHVFS